MKLPLLFKAESVTWTGVYALLVGLLFLFVGFQLGWVGVGLGAVMILAGNKMGPEKRSALARS